MNQVAVIVNYCSLEREFLPKVLAECGHFASEIVVSVGTHLYNGTPEDLENFHHGMQFNLGLASIRIGDLDNAKVYLEKALLLNPLLTDAQRLITQIQPVSPIQNNSGG